jgi:hypothetical protein
VTINPSCLEDGAGSMTKLSSRLFPQPRSAVAPAVPGADFVFAAIRRHIIGGMPKLNDCQEILRRLIAKGDVNGIPLAKRAINEYLDATPANARKSGLRLLQEDVLIQRDAVLGDQRSFADTVNDYIEKKLVAE